MAVSYGFFDSVGGDRKYSAAEMSQFYDSVITEGVFQNFKGGLAVSAGTGLSVSVAAGRANVQSKWLLNDAALTLSIDAASTTYGRIDAVVIRLSESSRNISIVVKKGTPASSPVAPSLTRSGGTYEMALAYVTVAANASSVSVTDKRSDSSLCGWAAVREAVPGEIDAQLEAMKTGFDGVVYDSPGAAVRACDNILATSINAEIAQADFNWELGSFSATGEEFSSVTRIRSNYINVSSGTKIKVSGNSNCLVVLTMNNKGAVIDYSNWINNSYTVPTNGSKVRILVRKSSSDPTIDSTEIGEQGERCTVRLVMPQQIYSFDETRVSNIEYFQNNDVDQSVMDWELGAFNPPNNEDYDSTTRIRSKLIPVSPGSKVSVNGNENCLIVMTMDSNNTIIDSTSWINNSYTVPANGYKIRLMIRKTTTNETINASEVSEQGARCSIELVIPKDVYDYKESYISDINEALNNGIPQSIMNWELGSFNNTGFEYDAVNRIRSDYIDVSPGTIIELLGNMNCLLVLAKSNEDVVIDYSGWIATNKYIVPEGTGKVKILVRKSTQDTTMTSADVPIEGARCSVNMKLPQDAYSYSSGKIPVYYNAYMEDKAETIRQNMASIGNHGDSLVFITDFHFELNTMHSPQLIKYIIDHCGINNIVFGGDAINSEATKADVYSKLEKFVNLFRKLNINPWFITGNHEYNNPSGSSDPSYIARQLTNAEIYPFFLKDKEIIPYVKIGDRILAYSVINHTQRIKYIYIPCSYTSAIDNDVVTWVNSEIASTESGFKVVLLAHNALASNGEIVETFEPIAEAFDTLIGTDTEPVCIICGHQHKDITSATVGGIPIIATTCDTYSQEQGGLNRTIGTVNEQAFDVYQIDTYNKVIKVVRIGAGTDRTISYGE